MIIDGLQLRMLRSRSTCKSELALHEMAWNEAKPAQPVRLNQPDDDLYRGDVLSLDSDGQWDTDVTVVWASDNER